MPRKKPKQMLLFNALPQALKRIGNPEKFSIHDIRGSLRERKLFFLADLRAARQLSMSGCQKTVVVATKDREEIKGARDIEAPLVLKPYRSLERDGQFGILVFCQDESVARTFAECIADTEPTQKDPTRVQVKNATLGNIELAINIFLGKRARQLVDERRSS